MSGLAFGMRASDQDLALGARRIMPFGLALVAALLLFVDPALAFEQPPAPQVVFGDLYASRLGS